MIFHESNGEYYGFSFRKFKDWKDEFKGKFKEVYGISFDKYIPDSKERAIIYKEIFKMSSVDVF